MLLRIWTRVTIDEAACKYLTSGTISLAWYLKNHPRKGEWWPVDQQGVRLGVPDSCVLVASGSCFLRRSLIPLGNDIGPENVQGPFWGVDQSLESCSQWHCWVCFWLWHPFVLYLLGNLQRQTFRATWSSFTSLFSCWTLRTWGREGGLGKKMNSLQIQSAGCDPVPAFH